MRLSSALLATVLLMGAAGCGSGHSSGSQAQQVRRVPPAAHRVTGTAVAGCALSQLAVSRGVTGEGLAKDFGSLLVRNNSRQPCAMRQAITIAAVDDQGLVVPIEGPHVVSPGALPWVLVSATDRHDPPSNALRRLGIVITGEYAPDFGTTCSSPRPAAPTAFRLTMGGSAKDVPNQWKGAVTTLGACRTAFSVGPTGRPDQLGRVPD
jgi:hypothetical protein